MNLSNSGAPALRPIFLAALVGALWITALSTASAHHSFAMFDSTREVTLKGTVTAFEWTNPHTWIEIDVPDETGKIKHWSIEHGSPLGLSREGWTRTSVKAGDRVTLVINPLHSGAAGGALKSIILADGRRLRGQGDPPPAAEGK